MEAHEPQGAVVAPTRICPHCAAQAQTFDKRCPNCGKKYKKRTLLKVVLFMALGGLALIAGCAALIAGGVEEAEKEQDRHAITMSQFRGVELGSRQGSVEAQLGRPEDKQEFENAGVLPGDEPAGSSCIYYNEKGKELLEGRTFQFCFDGRRLTAKNSY